MEIWQQDSFLITTKPGKEHDVRARLDEINEVTSRWMLFGEYDLIAKVESDEEYNLTRVIVEEIRPISGITDTKTLLGAEL
ncbi:MAG: AsnC family transcriptional regulator [Methanobacteriota archaeon]|nr:MAG: AsnC family transcriptional regulator [Euryarchaeota archaeon]